MSLDQLELRDTLGRFPTGVTVVTTATEGGLLGITANSFASVSLDPPLVLWSPARRSARYPAFEAASHFTIHILAQDQRWLADRFARTGDDFSGIAHTPGLGDAPLFEGCAARLECAHSAGHDGGDHLIVVGEVLRMQVNEVPPLVFHRGSYCAIGAEL